MDGELGFDGVGRQLALGGTLDEGAELPGVGGQAVLGALLGGGVKEPGWQNTRLSTSRLAVVPGYSHYNLLASPEVPQIVGKFLADPLASPSAGASAASQVAPASEEAR